MLCNLAISQWTARKLDKSATRKVTDDANASRDAARVTKALIAKESLAEIGAIAGAARNRHYELTLPWSNDGPRILSAAGFMNYRAAMSEYKENFERATGKFLDGYETFRENARVHLGELFNSADYPTLAEIKQRFAFRVDISPMPDASDFRVELGEAQEKLIRAEIEARGNEALALASKDVWNRIAKRAEHMAMKLREYKPGNEGERAQGIFRDSLVENVQELVGLLPSLNITNDPKLEAMGARLATELCNYAADELREDDNARKVTADAAEAILAEVSEYLA
jgi:hypothetical protein